MPLLTSLLAAAAVAAMRTDGDPPEAKSPRHPPASAPAIVVEGPVTRSWTIQPDPSLARRYAPPPYRPRRGIVVRF
jgi:hypothetical protein